MVVTGSGQRPSIFVVASQTTSTGLRGVASPVSISLTRSNRTSVKVLGK